MASGLRLLVSQWLSGAGHGEAARRGGPNTAQNGCLQVFARLRTIWDGWIMCARMSNMWPTGAGEVAVTRFDIVPVPLDPGDAILFHCQSSASLGCQQIRTNGGGISFAPITGWQPALQTERAYGHDGDLQTGARGRHPDSRPKRGVETRECVTDSLRVVRGKDGAFVDAIRPDIAAALRRTRLKSGKSWVCCAAMLADAGRAPRDERDYNLRAAGFPASRG